MKVEPLFPAMLRFVRFALLALPVASVAWTKTQHFSDEIELRCRDMFVQKNICLRLFLLFDVLCISMYIMIMIMIFEFQYKVVLTHNEN